MTYPEAIQFLYGLRHFGAKFGLENTFKLAALAGSPQEKLRFIHVAGTNGKGSTCAMLESIYRAAGLRAGLFTSPHLVSFRERIQVGRRLISEKDVTRLVAELRRTGVAPVSESVPNEDKNKDGDRRDACPTFFEFVTVMALKFFAEEKCDLVIWETGLGGRLDATNIVTPLASVITNIAFDHQQWLGDTLEKIAAEKAGIIKPGVPVVTAAEAPEAFAVIEKIAREKGAPLTPVAADVNPPLTSKISAVLSRDTATVGLAGEHQRTNAALALATVEILQSQIPVSEEAIRRGLASVIWPGRLQLIQRPNGQKILLDGAHNAAGAAALCAAIKSGAPVSDPARSVKLQRAGSETGAPVIIFGALADKKWTEICNILATVAAKVFTVPVASERTAAAEELAQAFREANSKLEVAAFANLSAALSACEDESYILITGSLYLVGEALEHFGLMSTDVGERALNDWTAPKSPR